LLVWLSSRERSIVVIDATSGDALTAGRERYAQRAWNAAHELLTRADRAASLDAGDLERLALSAYLIGHDDEYLTVLERAHHAHHEAGECLRAARCAFWLGLRLLFRGETGRATGWLARAQRLVEREGGECAEQGYLLVPLAQQQIMAGNHETAFTTAARAIDIGERFAEADLVACARHQQGRILLQRGQVGPGLALLDETMVAVVAGELSPLVTGLVYCSVIEGCQEVFALGRAREWTAALAAWCAGQPEMVAFTGVCLVHRAEILHMQGAWVDAGEEVRRAYERCALAANQRAVGAAHYQQGELHRLHGNFDAAEASYRSANEHGLDPQPGLALLRAAQGRVDAAAAAMRRVTSATAEALARARLLPAHVEIMLLAGAVEDARTAQTELAAIARRFDTEMLAALAAHARGLVELADGDAAAALASLRGAWHTWHSEAPYLAARARVEIGVACRTLGDTDGAVLEWGAARAVFTQLGARPDLARLDELARLASSGECHPLSERELQVLRLVARGETNRKIATELFVSEKTIDRHVSNILTKLNVRSRAAATAYAYEHQLI
jgi:DNA-binding CsgD family transcriptional regulator